jgi:bifunctional diaminopimelate decarboxylase / aspartate kinase
MKKQNSAWIIIKFGGTSVKDRASWDCISTIVQNHLAQKHQVLIVCSAPYRVSNLLGDLIQAALQKKYLEIFETIESIYKSFS